MNVQKQKNYRFIIPTIVFVLSIFGSYLPKATYAQETASMQTITLSPAVSRPEIKAGQVITDKVTIVNNGTTDYTFVLYARPFSVSNEQYDPDFTATSERTNAYKWISFSQATHSLKSGERIEVPYTVTVPTDVSPGGHYAVLFAETQPKEQVNATGVTRKERVGSLQYITVEGDTQLSGSIVSWEAQAWQRKLPLNSSVRIKNTGNVHFPVTARITYTDLFGKDRFTLNHQVLVLPDTTRKIDANWTGAPLLGIYKLHGSAEYLGNTESLPQKYVIFVSPIVLIGIVSLLLLLVLFLAVKKKRRMRSVGGRGKMYH